MPSSSWQIVPLHCLRAGENALIDQVLGEPEQVHRLGELGVRPGVSIEMVQPGSPCIVRLASSKLCFREADVLSVLVRVGEAA